MKIIPLLLLSLTLVLPAAGAQPDKGKSDTLYGPKFKANPNAQKKKSVKPIKGLDSVRRWNQIAIDASGLDHTPVADGENRKFGEAIGPGRASRAMAIVHIAIFDTVNAAFGYYESYTGVEAPKGPIDLQAAVSQAAHDTLVAVYPSQATKFHALLAEDLSEVKNKKAKGNGITLGKAAAAAVMTMRTDDGSGHPEPLLDIDYFPTNLAGIWRQDPISQIPVALGAHWSDCAPFVLQSNSQFRVPPPPPMGSPEYAAAYNEVKRLGGDGAHTLTERTPEQTFIGIFWAYDGTPSLCAPPRLYNQIAVAIADKMGSDNYELARLLALLNVAMADAGTASWESKYYWNVWRPVTAIRESDDGTGPTGSGDGNPDTVGDPNFTPLGAPASNLMGPNFTPPFPSYPSGHATFGGAIFQTLRRFYGTDRISFRFISDEYNGETLANSGIVRPLVVRKFNSLSQAEEENGQSRIYLGIHWSYDKVEGIRQGRKVGDYVFDNILRPLKKDHH